MRHSSTIIGLALLLSACASGSSAGGASSRDVITRAEIVSADQTNAYNVIRSMQPRWLRAGLSVYMDGALAAGGREATRDEGVEFLRTLGISGIQEMRFLDPQRASIRYGMGMGAVVEVITARR
jgi:hypothetical protein